MAKSRLRVAVVGAGMIANAGHIPAWKSRPEAEIVAVADCREDAARSTAQRHQIPGAYTDLSKMLAETRPDIVCVCTPNHYHKEQTIAALRAGAHVLCEKPAAGSYADAVEMFDAAEAAGKILFVGQSLRFHNALVAAKQFAAGQLGEVYHAQTTCLRRRGVPTWGQFHIKAHSDGGPLFDLGVHMLDALVWIMGNPTIVAASGATYCKLANRDEGLATSLGESGAFAGVFDPRPYDFRQFDVEDFGVGLLRLEGGATIGLSASWAANIPEGAGGTMILGTEGGLYLDPELALKLVRNIAGYQVDVTPHVPRDLDVAFPGHFGQAEHLVRVIRGEEQLQVRRQEVLNVVRGLEALYRSAAEGREVRLEQ